MGYSHYVDNVKVTKELAESARRILDVATADGIQVSGYYGDEPRIDEHCISVCGEGGECFTLVDEELSERTQDRDSPYHPFRFTKTNRMPYDAIVCAILITAMTQGQDEFSSDGTFTDWLNQGGIPLYETAVKPLTDGQAQHLYDILNEGRMDVRPISLDAYNRCSPEVQGVLMASFIEPGNVKDEVIATSNGNIEVISECVPIGYVEDGWIIVDRDLDKRTRR